MKRAVLAYSGGLDTSVGIRWLTEQGYEVHAVAGTKRGAHLALSLERLERLVERPFQRVALSATQRPMEEIGRFVAGGREIELVDAGIRKELDLQVVVPVDDMRELGSSASVIPSEHPAAAERTPSGVCATESAEADSDSRVSESRLRLDERGGPAAAKRTPSGLCATGIHASGFRLSRKRESLAGKVG